MKKFEVPAMKLVLRENLALCQQATKINNGGIGSGDVRSHYQRMIGEYA
tara:strand:+ start:463 stop:609 length:147 start_codon:yes stop_codon:yes gene_type:complete